MNNEFRLLMLSAMYENGGNATHRFLDAHPQLFVYPFESQLGTPLVKDNLSSLFPFKYRWPEFSLDGTACQDYKMIVDEECKVRAKTPNVSKFRHMPFSFSDDERCEIYQHYVEESGRSRSNNVTAFFKATFEAWKDYKFTGKQTVYVGYSPIIIVDAEKIMNDLPGTHMLHIVRNPWSAYADTKKRPVPMSLESYILCWSITQYFALLYEKKYPGHVHIMRFEDVLANPGKILGSLCEKTGIESDEALSAPTWNGIELEEIYPWGTIRSANTDTNRATANELSSAEKGQIRSRTWQYLEVFHYTDFV